MTNDNEPWNPEPDFWSYVREAYDACEAVDHFDLRSDDPESCAEFQALQARQYQAAMALICLARLDRTLCHFYDKSTGRL
jgi:hypothetical protein